MIASTMAALSVVVHMVTKTGVLIIEALIAEDEVRE